MRPKAETVVSRSRIMNNPRSERLAKRDFATSPRWSPAAFVADESHFLAALPVIDHVTGQVCRRHHLSTAEADEFRSDVRLHFIDRNYEVLRQFEGRSSLSTYITVVVQRLFLDRRNRLWGKWRPSAEARRLGPTAVLLEQLVSRDGWSCEQAIETLRVNHGVTIDDQLRALCDGLARRGPSRQMVTEDQAETTAAVTPTPEDNVVRAEQDFLAKRIHSALDRARQALPADERLILKMRFEDSVPVSDIARALHMNQRRLYRTLDRLLAQIAASLEAEGISRSEVKALFAAETLNTTDDREPAVDSDAGPAHRLAERERVTWLQK
jgi:RNA polymerase sigma factor (sigma-70 family)